jgi:hypothetical protein
VPGFDPLICRDERKRGIDAHSFVTAGKRRDMEQVFKFAYYAGTAMASLVMGFFFLASMMDQSNSTAARLVTLAAGATGFGLAYLGYRLGPAQGHWFAGLGLSVTAVFAAGLVMLLGMLTFTQTHWQ